MRNKNDILELAYVAFGFEYLLMATHSSQTAKEHNPWVHCTLVTNLKIEQRSYIEKFFDQIIYVELENNKNRDIKTSIIDYVHKDKCAFIDCDTEFKGDISPVIKYLDRYDIALKSNSMPVRKDYWIDSDIHGSVFPQWNSGVLFFRREERTKRFFKDWKKFYVLMGKRSDQPGLTRAMYYNSDLRVLSLGCIWNTFENDFELLVKQKSFEACKIWHYRDTKFYPDMAVNISHHLGAIKESIDSTDPHLKEEIRSTQMKYRIFSSLFFRYKTARYIVFSLHQLLRKAGFRHLVALNRVRYKEGEKFKYLKQ